MSKIKVDFDSLDNNSRSKIVKGSVIPRPIAWITSLNEDGGLNLAPFSFFNAISPSLLAVSFQKNDIDLKDTFINIVREKEAVIHLVDESMIEAMDTSSKVLPRNKSELDMLDLTINPSMKIRTPGIEEALIRFETVLESTIPLMNYEHSKEEGDLVLLRIVATVLDDNVYDKERHHIFADKLNPIARLGGADYSGIKKIDFKREF